MGKWRKKGAEQIENYGRDRETQTERWREKEPKVEREIEKRTEWNRKIKRHNGA